MSERLNEIKAKYIELAAMISTETDETEKKMLQNERNGMKTVVESLQALEEIDRDLVTFQDVIDENDETNRAKEIQTASIFINEFLGCKRDIESQLTSYIESLKT